MNFIDSHCHLAAFAREGSLEAVLGRAAGVGVVAMVCVGTEPEDWALYRELVRQQRGVLYYTVGLHPCSVGQGWREAVAALPAYFERDLRPVAIGEIGLDYFHLPKDEAAAEAVKAEQRAAFRFQLELARTLGTQVVVHSRKSFFDCVREIDASGVDWRRVVFHCFSEGPEAMRELNRRGGRGSFTGILTYPNARSIPAAAVEQGIERFMLETDAPYLSPQAVRGLRNEPAHLVHTAAAAAHFFGVSVEALAAAATRATREFFGLGSDLL
ncbi:MAG: TatD family hydrolase [Puniceicoccales bacterium]|jgi:TatD DNase family protein|nr:TatD family hydrolase [Puniceicoccales bacterium]